MPYWNSSILKHQHVQICEKKISKPIDFGEELISSTELAGKVEDDPNRIDVLNEILSCGK